MIAIANWELKMTLSPLVEICKVKIQFGTLWGIWYQFLGPKKYKWGVLEQCLENNFFQRYKTQDYRKYVFLYKINDSWLIFRFFHLWCCFGGFWFSKIYRGKYIARIWQQCLRNSFQFWLFIGRNLEMQLLSLSRKYRRLRFVYYNKSAPTFIFSSTGPKLHL